MKVPSIIMAASAAVFVGSAASAATCTPGASDGVWITSVDGSLLNEDGTCETAYDLDEENENLSGDDNISSKVIAGLKSNDWFSLLDTSTLTWDYVGKEEAEGTTGTVDATIGSNSGTWSATFSPNTVDWFVLVFKGANVSILALFDENGMSFEGGFNMANLGVVNGNDIGQDLSNFQVVGAYVGTSVVPLPAAGWLLIAGLGGLAALRRRKQI